MSFEHMPPMRRAVAHETLNEKELDDAIEDLLHSFPEESRPRIEERMDGLTGVEQLSFLETALRRRRELLAVPKYKSEGLHMMGVVPGTIFEREDAGQREVEVGRGENGRVFEYKTQVGEGVTIVYKMLIRAPMEFQNDLMTEAAYQTDVANFAEDHADTRISVPHTFFVASSSRGYVLAMEKVRGHSVKDILTKNIRLPRDYDFAALENGFVTFLGRMNEAGFYHRDIREGNIMVDPEPPSETAPLGQVIDFGFCVKAGSVTEAYQTVDGVRDHVTIHGVIERLKMQQERLWQEAV